MDCWPACNSWCECVNGDCKQSTNRRNALRFRTPDGRYLQARNGGGSLLSAADVAGNPQQWETFLIQGNVPSPLTDSSPIQLDVCNFNWTPVNEMLIRVDHRSVSHRTSDGTVLVHGEVGGAGQNVYVRKQWPQGTAFYDEDDTTDCTFKLEKVNGSGSVTTGDLVRIRIDASDGNTWYFRVEGDADQAEVFGDGASGDPGTEFTVEVNEVRTDLGWRPTYIRCRDCAAVRIKVTRTTVGASCQGRGLRGGIPLVGAHVVAQPSSQPFEGWTLADGKTPDLKAYVQGADRTCIPAGKMTIKVSCDRHQTASFDVNVPVQGRKEFPVELACTSVTGKIVDGANTGLKEVSVYLLDQSGNILLDENDNPYVTTTSDDGSFSFCCVQHVRVQILSDADTTKVYTADVPPEGLRNVTIVIQNTCGDLVGRVVDADTNQGISGATITDIRPNGTTVTADKTGCFTFTCLKPAGNHTLTAKAAAYTPATKAAQAPATGSATCANPAVTIPLKRKAATTETIRCILSWGTKPKDLDAHLSGHNPAFHLFYANRQSPPVSYVALDVDNQQGHGPETLTIRRSGGAFSVDDYHVWAHDYSNKSDPNATFVDSGATLNVEAVDSQGNTTPIGKYHVKDATGTPDALWHVVNLHVAADGTVTVTKVQMFKSGSETTIL